MTAGKQSSSGKEWKFPCKLQLSEELIAAAGGSALLASILYGRGVSDEKSIERFLDWKKYEPSSPMELAAMPVAINRISQAIEEREQITVYGDYDVDGITGTALLVTVLNLLGAKVDFYIPNRAEEGYGLNLKAVSILASKRQTKLIVTCDCGVSNFSEINLAKSIGVDTIVVDHHALPELLPPAVAILHPKLLPEDHPLYNLPGVGVAYKLGEALLGCNGRADQTAQLLDYVAMGMIADMVPLIRENRYLVQIGLPQLKASPREGIQALLAQLGRTSDGDMVGFGLAPRINAVGRLADANIAVELMTTTDAQTAQRLAQQLELDNNRRQELCQNIFLEAERKVQVQSNFATDKVIVVYQEGWHHGVAGIVASRLVEKFHRPAFVGELDLAQGSLKGSARSVDGLDLYEVLKANSSLLNRWGGHKMAAGFSLDADKASTFKTAITQTCNQMLSGRTLVPVLEIDALLEPGQVSMQLVNELSMLAPFGVGNKKPIMVMENLHCTAAMRLGKEGKHARLFVQDDSGDERFEAVVWNHGGKIPELGSILDLAFTPEINNYGGRQRLQLVVGDWRGSVRKFPDEAPAQDNRVRNQSHKQANYLPAKVATPAVATKSVVTPCFKDLRTHPDKNMVLETALRRSDALIFGENITTEGKLWEAATGKLIDRNDARTTTHLLFWSYPPSLEVFGLILANCSPQNIYMIGADAGDALNVDKFLRQLVGLIKFAVNKREGRADSTRLSAALATTDMCVALGLALLKKSRSIDWFSDNGILHLNLLGQPVVPIETVPEFRQLAGALKDTMEFRLWCAQTQLALIDSALSSYAAGQAGSRYNSAGRQDQLFVGDAPNVSGVNNFTAQSGANRLA